MGLRFVHLVRPGWFCASLMTADPLGGPSFRSRNQRATIPPLLGERAGVRASLGLLTLVLIFASLPPAIQAQSRTTRTTSLQATEAFAQWLVQEQASAPPAFADPLALARGLNLAQARAQEMRNLMEIDPEQFVQRAMSETDRAQLPRQIQGFIEQRNKGRGFFGVYCAGLPTTAQPGSTNGHPHGGYAYEIRLNGVTYHAFAFGKWRDQTTVYEADIEGVTLGDAIAVGDAPTPSEQVKSGGTITAYAPTTTGPNTLLYMIAEYSDQANSYPIDDTTALAQAAVISNFWMNCSYGRVYLHGLVNGTQPMDIVHITLPQPSSFAATYNNNFAQLLSDARTAAASQGFNYANYNLDVVITTASGYS